MKKCTSKKLAEIDMNDHYLYGSKAATLGALSKDGFEVPEGFALSIDCFDSFLYRNQFPFRPDDYRAYSSEIREFIQSRPLSPELTDVLGHNFEALRDRYPQDRIIVRTSALCEDSLTSSMAGVFASFPDIVTLEEVMDAVRGCYLSLFSDSVIDRHAAERIESEKLKAGVIVQRYIMGDTSGVTFTADTTEMEPGKIRISAVRGLCAGLTSGSEPATTYMCDKKTSAILGIFGDRQILTEEQLSILIANAQRIEARFGCYQDIEWTLAGRTLHILQARPITGFREASGTSIDWKPEEGDREQAWGLNDDTCLPPLIAELVVETENQTGACAYSYGMHWDSVAFMQKNGYVYRRKREIPNAKKRIDEFIGRINAQFDCGEDEFDKYIRPELAALIDAMHEKYVDRTLTDDALVCYLNEAEFFMRRSARLHWRATTSEWYMGHFFRKRIERFYDAISNQDLVDMVYSKSLMSTERDKLYEMVAVVNADADLNELFRRFEFDKIIEARLERMQSPAVDRLLDLMDNYSREYGWYYSGHLEDGVLCTPGSVSREQCVNRLKRYLHISLDDYQANLVQIAENSDHLRKFGSSKCKTKEDRTDFRMALMAGEKAFLAGDNHAFYICSRKYVYVCDALRRIARTLVERGALAEPDDIRYLHLDEIRACLSHASALKELIAERKEEHRRRSRVWPPEQIGTKGADEPTDASGADLEGDRPTVIKGESGTRKDAHGRIHVGFSKNLEDDVILLLDHGHEGDLTTILGRVKGIIMKMGTPACHMGIIARELGIPAIYGVGDQADFLKQGDEVEIHGQIGEIVSRG